MDGGDEGAGGGGVGRVEQEAEIGVGADGVGGEVRVLVGDEFPDFLLRLRFTGAVDGPGAVGRVGWRLPGGGDVGFVPAGGG